MVAPKEPQAQLVLRDRKVPKEPTAPMANQVLLEQLASKAQLVPPVHKVPQVLLALQANQEPPVLRVLPVLPAQLDPPALQAWQVRRVQLGREGVRERQDQLAPKEQLAHKVLRVTQAHLVQLAVMAQRDHKALPVHEAMMAPVSPSPAVSLMLQPFPLA